MIRSAKFQLSVLLFECYMDVLHKYMPHAAIKQRMAVVGNPLNYLLMSGWTCHRDNTLWSKEGFFWPWGPIHFKRLLLVQMMMAHIFKRKLPTLCDWFTQKKGHNVLDKRRWNYNRNTGCSLFYSWGISLDSVINQNCSLMQHHKNVFSRKTKLDSSERLH